MDDASLSLDRAAATLSELDVVVVDCQASGATPAHGAVLELGWAIAGARGVEAPIEASWIAPPVGTRVSRPVRELTGWNEDCLTAAVSPEQAWSRLLEQDHRPRDGARPVRDPFRAFRAGISPGSPPATRTRCAFPSTPSACTRSPGGCFPSCRGETCARWPAISGIRQPSCVARPGTSMPRRSSGMPSCLRSPRRGCTPGRTSRRGSAARRPHAPGAPILCPPSAGARFPQARASTVCCAPTAMCCTWAKRQTSRNGSPAISHGRPIRPNGGWRC